MKLRLVLLGVVSGALSGAVTGPTLASAAQQFVPDEVVSTQWVAQRAGCFGGVNRRYAGAAENVLAVRDSFEVVGAYATRISAKMVQFKVVWDSPSTQLEYMPVCPNVPSLGRDLTVPPVAFFSNPLPASIFANQIPDREVTRGWTNRGLGRRSPGRNVELNKCADHRDQVYQEIS